MASFLIYLLIGFGSGLIIFPIALKFILVIRNAIERRRIKRMMKAGKFLITIDPKDYDTEAWKNKKYGNIDSKNYEEDLKNLNKKIFKDKYKEDNVILVARDYVQKARKLKYKDEQIIMELRNKNYSNEMINKIMQGG